MDKEAVKLFAAALGSKVESISSQGWAQIRCPLARWTHDTGKDSNASAAISIKANDYSHFVCFTCEHHDLLSLCQRIKELGLTPKGPNPKANLKAAIALCNDEGSADLTLAIKEYDAPKGEVEDDGNNDAVFSLEWLESFPKARFVPLAVNYLRGRGLDDYTIDDLGIRWDVNKRAVCFPTLDQYGRLCGLRGRYIAPKEDQPPYHIYKNESGHYNRNVWIGENHLDWDKPVVMVESVFDYAAVYPIYENVCGPLTVGMGPRKVKRMAAALDIITLFDLGKGGDKARKLIDKYLSKNQRVHLLPCGPHRSKPGELATDPGEMTPASIIELLEPYLPKET